MLIRRRILGTAGFVSVASLVLCVMTATAQPPATNEKTDPTFNRGPLTPYSVAAQPSTDVLRFRRGERFNIGNSSLSELGEGSEAIVLDLPPSHGAQKALPVQQSDTIIVATVETGRSLLSNDKKAIYSEFHARVEDVLKTSALRYIRPGDFADVEREGGRVLLPSGKTLVRGRLTRSMPVTGCRYLFFLRYDPNTEDYHIETAYQLQSSKAYRLDDPSYAEAAGDGDHHALCAEGKNIDDFLALVRNQVTVSKDSDQ